MDSLEPFDLKKAVPFNPVYMAGYVADRYDVDQKANEGRLDARIEDVVDHDIRNQLRDYAAVDVLGSRVQVGDKKVRYALLPVWVLSSSWNGEIYTYAMNGQTGKVSGRIPVDPKSVHTYWCKFSAIYSVIAFIVICIVLLFM